MRKRVAMALLAALCASPARAEDRYAHIVDVRASPPSEPADARRAADGDYATRWSSQPTDPQWIRFELAEPTVIDGVTIHWEAAFAETYQVQVSEDGEAWYVAQSVIKHWGGTETLSFTPVRARFVRIFGVSRGTRWGYSILECLIRESDADPVPIARLLRPHQVSYARSDLNTAAWHHYVAARRPATHYPRWLRKEQAYWTVAGVPGAREDAVFSEDGIVEPLTRGFTVEPFVLAGTQLLTAVAADRVTQSLADGYLPIPTVAWQKDGLRLSATLFAFGRPTQSCACVLYDVRGGAGGQFFAALRPFQVNPPWMNGGLAKVQRIAEEKGTIHVDGRAAVIPLRRPSAFGAKTSAEGDIVEDIALGRLPETRAVDDPEGLASAALAGRLSSFGLPFRQGLVMPLAPRPDPPAVRSLRAARAELERTRRYWRKRLNRVEIDVPQAGLFDVFRANLAYLIINADGDALSSGPRNYERSWMRDGSTMAVAALQCGEFDLVRRYLLWMAARQQPTGEMPPVVDADGRGQAEREYDAQGEFLYAAAEYYRYTRDRDFAAAIFPACLRAAQFIETLRNQRIGGDFVGSRFEGILPTSVSHEGFPPPGAHSYFDDWYALKGLRDFQYLARELGKTGAIGWAADLEKGLRGSLLRSIRITMRANNLRHLPSSAEAHEDACGNAVAVWPTEEDRHLPQGALESQLESWYRNVFLPDRREGVRYGFTPYELRMIPAFLALGEREKAWSMLEWYLSVVRPEGWLSWGEGVGAGYRDGVYLGDMPHSWVGAMYINALRMSLAFERDQRLVLAAGIPSGWLESRRGIGVSRLPTPFGELNYRLVRRGDAVILKAWGDAAPPKGFVLRLPGPARDVAFAKLPARVVVRQ